MMSTVLSKVMDLAADNVGNPFAKRDNNLRAALDNGFKDVCNCVKDRDETISEG